MSETQGQGLPNFRDGDHARRWLLERLDRLEEAIGDAGELQHTAASLTADAMAQLEGDPLSFRKTAVIHLRDLEGALTDVSRSRAGREGIHVAALERLVLDVVGQHPAQGREIVEGLVLGLRERMDALSLRGGEGLESGQLSLDDALAALDQSLHRVVRRWEQEATGVWRRWRRRRRLARQGVDQLAGLPELALGLTDAARGHRPAFEAAWSDTSRSAVALGIASSYAATLDWLAEVLAGFDGLARQAAEVARDAGQRIRRLPGSWREADAVDRTNLLTVALLDRVLDEIGIHTAGYLGRSETHAADLGRTSRKGLVADLTRWIETELPAIEDLTLARVWGGQGPSPDLVGPLVEVLTAGQPLMRFNDDLHRMWPDGLPAQMHLVVSCSDDSLETAMADACSQIGWQPPQWETRVDDGEPSTLTLRMVQLVSGLAWFSAAERLLPMIREHRAVMAEADEGFETREGIRAALRDSLQSETLPPLLPDEVEAALGRLDALQARARGRESRPEVGDQTEA